MNAKDVKCPICGTVNRSLDLDETDGWMECEHCHNAVQVLEYVKTRHISVYQMADCNLLVPLSKKKDKRSMAMLEDWTIYSWYCPNCKTQVAGLKNKKNQIRVICTKCGVEMVRTVVSRRHDVIDMFAPSGMEHSELELREH